MKICQSTLDEPQPEVIYGFWIWGKCTNSGAICSGTDVF